MLSHGHTILLLFTRQNHLNDQTADLKGRIFLSCPGWWFFQKCVTWPMVKLHHIESFCFFGWCYISIHCSSQHHKELSGGAHLGKFHAVVRCVGNFHRFFCFPSKHGSVDNRSARVKLWSPNLFQLLDLKKKLSMIARSDIYDKRYRYTNVYCTPIYIYIEIHIHT